MSTTFSTFCNEVIADAVIQPPIANGMGGEIMTLTITTDTGDYFAIHFKNQINFKAFCAKHNFPLESKINAN
jgi:hypothetical protein